MLAIRFSRYRSYQLFFICLLILSGKSFAFDIVYNVFIDRFNQGRCEHCSKDDINLKDSKAFHGGNIPGVIEKLPYLKDLGITAIQLTPFLENHNTYHGYAPVNFEAVDKHFGSKDDLKKLVKLAHEQELKVIIDVQINHSCNYLRPKGCTDCGYNKKGYELVPDGSVCRAKTPSWMNNPAFFNNVGVYRGGGIGKLPYKQKLEFYGLDDFDSSNPFVKKELTDIWRTWIKELGVDGIRVDVADLVEKAFLKEFQKSMLKELQGFSKEPLIILENVSSEPGLRIENSAAKELNFKLYESLNEYITDKKDLKTFIKICNEMISQNSFQHKINFVSNYDFGRLLNSKTCKDQSECARKLTVAYGILLFMRQDFSILYGDELGVVADGMFDDLRVDLFAPDRFKQLDIYLNLKKLFSERKNVEVLGDLLGIQSIGDVLIFRYAKGKIVFNISSELKKMSGFSLAPLAHQVLK